MNKVIETKEIARGKWIAMNEVKYQAPDGKTRIWESVTRTTKAANHIADVVSIIPILRRSLHHNCFVTVKQFRPPLGAYTMEFPAGLIDKTDATIETAALRELFEETGYVGKTIDISDTPTATNSGVMGTTMVSVIVDINGDDELNVHPKQNLDEGEFVEVILLPIHEFDKHLQAKIASFKNEKVIIDSRVQAFASGLKLGESLAAQHSVGKISDDSPFGFKS